MPHMQKDKSLKRFTVMQQLLRETQSVGDVSCLKQREQLRAARCSGRVINVHFVSFFLLIL